jgi:hypothetical protein
MMNSYIQVYSYNGEEYYIAKVHNEDAYYKYNLVGCRIKLRTYMTYNYPYTQDYCLVRGTMLDGPFAGEEISFWKVKLSVDFPFFTIMKEAIK